jgi:hypothetical protein
MPKTLIDEEVKTRMQSLKERLWWDNWYNQYITQIWEEQKIKMEDEIRQSSKDSLEKFFLFRKFVELLWIDSTIDWNKPLDPEQKTYDKLVWATESKVAPKKTTKKK